MALRIGRELASCALALLLLAPTPASAAPAPERKAPRAPLVQDYRPRPALWLLEDADTRIYLLGTVHLLPPGFRWRSPAIDAAVKAADELVVESYDAPDEPPSPDTFPLFLLDQPVPLLDRVAEQHRPALQKQIASGPIPLPVYATMKTWAAALVLGIADAMGRWGIDDPAEAPGVEDVLEASFRAAGKPIGSIEDAKVVLASMDEMSEAEQRELLASGLAELSEAGGPPDDGDKVDHAWAQGKADEFDEALQDMPPRLFDILVVRRNAAWAEWLAKRLERPGTTLVAVGAGHLAGAASVQKMLEKRGLAVKRHD